MDEAPSSSKRPDIETPPPDDSVFSVEQRGIDFIPPAERWGRPRDLFWMWMGTVFNIEYVVYGALAIAIGLSFAQAVWVIIAANLTYVLLGICSLQGPEAGTSVFVITRAPFGHNGGRGMSVFNWATMVGYEVEGLALAVLAGLALMHKLGASESTPLKIVLILVASGLQLLLPLFGHATILRVLKWLAGPFIVMFVLLLILAAPKMHLSGVHTSANFATVAIVFALLFSVTGLGWNYNGSDYTRYLPKDTPRPSIASWVGFGAFIPSTLLMLLGAAVATATASASDPISGLPSVLPEWFLIPYLLVIIVQLFAINTIVLYSSGLTLQAVGFKLRRSQAVWVDTVACAALTTVTIFSAKFNTYLSDFLLFIIIWAAPWSAIYIVDWALRRGRYSSSDLLRSHGGLYWRAGGWNIRAVVAQLIGMGAAALAIDTSVYVGPLSNAANGADFSAFMGLIFGGGVYYLLSRSSVARELEAGGPSDEPVAATELPQAPA